MRLIGTAHAPPIAKGVAQGKLDPLTLQPFQDHPGLYQPWPDPWVDNMDVTLSCSQYYSKFRPYFLQTYYLH